MPPELKFANLFGDNNKGNKLVAKICDYKFRHHQKKGRSFPDTPLCIPYAVGQLCPKGKGCPNNHCSRKDIKKLANQRADAKAVDTLITNQYPKKWQSPFTPVPIDIAPNVSSNYVIGYSHPKSLLAVAKRRRVGESPKKVPTGKPSSRPSYQRGKPSLAGVIPTSEPGIRIHELGAPTGTPTGEPSSEPSGKPRAKPSLPPGVPRGEPTGTPSSKPSLSTGKPRGKPRLCSAPPTSGTSNGQPNDRRSSTKTSGKPSIGNHHGPPSSGNRSTPAPTGRVTSSKPKVLHSNKETYYGQKLCISISKTNYVGWYEEFRVWKSKESTQNGASFEWNQNRLTTRNDADHRLLSKCPLPSDLSSVFNPPVFTPNDENFAPSAWFLAAIKAIVRKPTPTPKPAPFKFSTETASVAYNTQILQHAGNNFATIIDNNQETLLSYSSEFRSLDDLSSIYRHHDTFPFFAGVHQHGMHYAFTSTLSNDERMAELKANIARGNHRSATERAEILDEKLERDVRFGFSVPVWASSLLDMPGTMVQACGLAVQQVLEGIKYRLTHDLSFSITGEDVSVNNRCDINAYPEMVYGFCSSRIIHYIVALRGKYPEERILISKYDFFDTFRRIRSSVPPYQRRQSTAPQCFSLPER